MFSDLTPVTALPVKDLGVARRYYEGKLGLKEMRSDEAGIGYQSGSGMIYVYPSEYAGSNKATAVSFMSDREHFNAEVDALRAKGITFQTFDYPGINWEDDVALLGEDKSVWFNDPDGNILSVSTMMP